MKGPDFICIGAQKAGTGWLYDQLRPHPDFWMPPLKELHYFDRAGHAARELRSAGINRIDETRRWARDERDHRFLDIMEELRASPAISYDLYADLFGGGLISGDITPGYSALAQPAITGIVDHFPKTKVIFFARDPVERAWSQLSMWVRHGVIQRSDIHSETIEEQLRRPELTSRSYPSQIVATWRRFVRPDLFRVFFFDDLRRDAVALRREVIEFLGGRPGKPSGTLSPGYNPKASKEKLRLTEDMRMRVARFFEAELKACAAELGGPAANWPGRYGL